MEILSVPYATNSPIPLRGGRKLQLGICGGSIHGAIHHSHSLSASHGVTWCQRCGAFSTRWPRQLVLPCRGRPGTIPQRNVLRRLLGGLPPTTASYLQDVAQASGRPATSTDDITVITVPGVSEHTRSRPVGVYHRLPRVSSTSLSSTSMISSTTPGPGSATHSLPSSAMQLLVGGLAGAFVTRENVVIPSTPPSTSSDGRSSRRRLKGKTLASTVVRHSYTSDVSAPTRGGIVDEQGTYDILVLGAGVRHWLEDEQGVEAAERRLLATERISGRTGQQGGASVVVTPEAPTIDPREPKPPTQKPSPSSAASPSPPTWPRLPRRTSAASTADSTMAMRHCGRNSDEAHWIRQVATNRMSTASSCNVCGGLTRLRCKSCVQALCIDCVKNRLGCKPGQPRLLQTELNRSSMAPE